MSAVLQFDQTGAPAEVLNLRQRDVPSLKPHEVLVAMRYAPVNPADLNFIEGTYGRPSNPPAVPGIEGCGEVAAVGSEVKSLHVGDHVILLHGIGSWAQHVVAPEYQLAKLPAGIDLHQASMLRVNPVTAWRLIHDYVDLNAEEWLVQNAANSGVGRALIQIARKLGRRTLNFVRRPDVADELRAIGADAVFIDDDEGIAAARKLAGEHPPRLAANAVGGDSALRQFDLLAVHGVQVTYGAMSRRSIKVPNRHLIFKDITLRGLWVTRWLEHADHADIYAVLHPLALMMIDGSLRLAVDRVFPMRDYRAALARATEGGRDGKVLVDLQQA